MKILRIVLIVVAFVFLAAHFSRAGNDAIAVVTLALPLLLAVRKPWAGWTLRILLFAGALEWVRTLLRLVAERRAAGDDWVRLAVILAAVAVVTLLAAFAVRIRAPETTPDGS
ncbi:MAG: hypothetical protein M8866_00530 [marine benthic group bacterium]|nr:hypothetical protein [Candidatus Benthicola marisminoris]